MKTHRGFLIVAGSAAVLIAAIALRVYRAGDPFGGYLAFNEAWYALVARNYASHSFLNPTVWAGQPDFNLPPFFSYLLYVSWRIFHGGEFTFRMVPIVFDIGSCALVFVLGRRYYGIAAGLAAAGLFAVSPMCVVVGRNVQTDAVWMFFALAAVESWLRSGRGANVLWSAISGLLLGFALFTKPTSIMVAVGVMIWELLRGGGFPKRIYAVLLPAVLVPAPYYLCQLTMRRHEFIAAQKATAAWAAGAQGGVASVAASELFWGLSPVLFAAAVIGIAIALWRRRQGDILCLLCIAAVAMFFAKWHLHGYYLRPIAPFAFLLAGRWMVRLPRWVGIPIVGVMMTSSIVFSLVFLGGAKYGAVEMRPVEAEMRKHPGGILLARNNLWASMSPVVVYYGRGAAKVEPESRFALSGARGSRITPTDRDTFLLGFVDGSMAAVPGDRVGSVRETYAPVVAGYSVIAWIENPNFFRLTNIRVQRVAPVSSIGMIHTGTYPMMTLVRLPKGAVIPVSGDRIYP